MRSIATKKNELIHIKEDIYDEYKNTDWKKFERARVNSPDVEHSKEPKILELIPSSDDVWLLKQQITNVLQIIGDVSLLSEKCVCASVSQCIYFSKMLCYCKLLQVVEEFEIVRIFRNLLLTLIEVKLIKNTVSIKYCFFMRLLDSIVKYCLVNKKSGFCEEELIASVNLLREE